MPNGNQTGAGKVSGILKKIWRVVRWPLGVVVVLYIGLVIFRIPAVLEKEVTAEAVAAIHAQRLTMADVDGSNLPPTPDPKRVDATVEGVDENENGIRDDVELAIFKKYPNNQRVRAAVLQYALSQQKSLTKVFNSETWKAVDAEVSRAITCIKLSGLTGTVVINATREATELILNTPERKSAKESSAENITSSGSAPEPACDVSF